MKTGNKKKMFLKSNKYFIISTQIKTIKINFITFSSKQPNTPVQNLIQNKGRVREGGDVYEAKYWGLLKIGDQKWGEQKEKFTNQISRAKQFLSITGNPNKEVIFNTDLSQDMFSFLQSQQIQIRKLENGKLVSPQVIP